MEFERVLNTSKKSKGINTCQYIIFHNTWWGTYESNCKLLSEWTKNVSCHFVIWPDGQMAKIWHPEDILWHTWKSSWFWLQDEYDSMNKYSIGIELVWPYKHWFYDKQRTALKNLTKHLMEVYWIPIYRVLRHKDVAPWRKVDIDDRLWNDEFESFDAWKFAKLLNWHVR